MKRAHVLELLTQSKPMLAARYGVTRLALFGSTQSWHVVARIAPFLFFRYISIRSTTLWFSFWVTIYDSH